MKDHSELISRLAAEGAKPAMSPPGRRVMAWLGVIVVYLAGLSAFKGMRPDLPEKLDNPFFWVEILLLLGTAISAALAAGWLALPDVGGRPRIRFVPLLFLVPLGGYVLFQQLMPELTGAKFIEEFGHTSWHCIWHLALFSIPPGILLFWLVKKGAPTKVQWAGGMVTLSVAALGYLVMRFVEPTDDALHLLVWHTIPLAAFCGLGICLGRLRLRW